LANNREAKMKIGCN